MNKSVMHLSATIGVSFKGPMALTRYSLQVVNNGTNPVEGLYHFALPRSSSLMKCDVMMEGRTFSGQVLRRNEASNVYEEAVETGKRSVMLESMNDGVYGLNVGNLDGGESLTIEMTIASLLTITNAGDTFTYRLPTTLAPRYGQTGNDMEPEYHFFAEYPFSATVNLPHKAQVQASSHALLGDASVIKLNGLLDRDIFVTWQQDACDQLFNASYRGYSYTLGVPNVASSDALYAPSGSSFLHVVLDRSGSMEGAAIDLCKQVLIDVVQNLSSSVAFNITSFGFEHETLFAGRATLNTQHKKAALVALNQVCADMGGTELISALLHAITYEKPSEKAKHIMLITDGLMHLDEEEVAAVQLACEKHNAHLHIIGVGYSVNTQALVRLSHATGGTLHIVNPNGELKEVVKNTVKAIHSTALPVELCFTKLTDSAEVAPMAWSSGDTVWYTNLPQPVFAQGECSLTVAGHQHEWRSETVNGECAQALVHIAAAQHIHELEREAATELATHLGMLSLYTSFVMLDVSEECIDSPATPRVIPQMVPPDVCFRLAPPSAISHSAAGAHMNVSYAQDRHDDFEYFCLGPVHYTSVEQLVEVLLNDMNRRWWRKTQWTAQYLRKLEFATSRVKELEDLALQAHVSLYVVAVCLVLARIDAASKVCVDESAKGRNEHFVDTRASETSNGLAELDNLLNPAECNKVDVTARIKRRLDRLVPTIGHSVKQKVAEYYERQLPNFDEWGQADIL